jgi:TolB protein
LKRTRIAAALSALLLIGIVIAVSAGQGDGGGSRGERSETGPKQGPAPGEGEHGEHFSDIYVIDLASRTLKRITRYQLAQQPSWSPNRRIAFSSAPTDESYARLFYVDAKGTDQIVIRAGVRHLFHPSWSPDGRAVAAAALGHGIYTIALSDHETRRLTSGQSDEAPAWSPRGDWIAFDKQVSGANYDLFAVNTATRKLRRLTRDRLAQTNPSWSPDGSRLAFAEQQTNGKWAVFTMRFDGSGRKRVTRRNTSAQEPAWSPDGRKIAFIDQGLDRASLAIVGVAGGRVRVLTPRSIFPSKPAWSPDGKRIAFSATENAPAQ